MFEFVYTQKISREIKTIKMYVLVGISEEMPRWGETCKKYIRKIICDRRGAGRQGRTSLGVKAQVQERRKKGRVCGWEGLRLQCGSGKAWHCHQAVLQLDTWWKTPMSSRKHLLCFLCHKKRRDKNVTTLFASRHKKHHLAENSDPRRNIQYTHTPSSSFSYHSSPSLWWYHTVVPSLCNFLDENVY